MTSFLASARIPGCCCFNQPVGLALAYSTHCLRPAEAKLPRHLRCSSFSHCFGSQKEGGLAYAIVCVAGM